MDHLDPLAARWGSLPTVRPRLGEPVSSSLCGLTLHHQHSPFPETLGQIEGCLAR